MPRPKKNCIGFVAVLLLYLLFFGLSSYANNQQDNHFYFVQMTDTHFDHGDHLKRTKKVVAEINHLPMPIQCVVHTGDITMDRITDEKITDAGLSIFKNLKVPIHFVAGNHDILPEKLKKTCKLFDEKFGGLISQAEYHHVLFVFICTEPLRKSFTIKNYHPLKQLEAMLKNADGKPVIIFHHAPSVDDFYNNTKHKGWNTGMKKKWIELINAYNVKAVIAGHFHRDEHHWLGNVPLYVCPPVAGYWGRQATYRIYEYRNGKIGYRTQYIE